MRDFKGMKRQRGRNRPGGGGGKPGGGGNANRAFDSNGPENLRVRGSAQNIYEKYTQLARDAGAGDRVLLENYLQHAEHYYRLIRTLQPQRPPADIMGRDTFTNGYDIDFEDEAIEAQQALSEAAGEAAAAAGEDMQPQQPQEGQAFQGRREERPYRDERPQGQREFRDRDDRPREGGQREFRDRDGRSDRGQAGGDRGPRADRDRPREGRFGEREGRFGERPRDETPREVGPTPSDSPVGVDASVEDDGRMLRDEEGGLSPAPAFLQASASPPPSDGEPRPRRRRRSRGADEGAEDSPAPTEAEDA